jgi:hypothetical protein
MIGDVTKPHRRKDVQRLQEAATDLPLLVKDTGYAYAVYVEHDLVVPLIQGRYEVIHAFIAGWRGALQYYTRRRTGEPAVVPCPCFLPDHNGECLNCDDWIDVHTPEAIAAGERAAAGIKDA